MKFNFKSILIIYCAVSLLISCEEDIPVTFELPVSSPIYLDADAGDWQNVMKVNYLNEISLPIPSDVNSEDYKAELEELRVITENRTPDQEIKVRYWAAGGVLRWNRILRELVAKYNTAPGALPNPQKPVANPPFAARAYAMLSVSQHDALIAAWKLKFSINRPAPSSTDNRINMQLGSTELPSYPSEQAVIAAASIKILKTLFPLESDFLDQLATEQINTIQWSGNGTASDVEDGWQLGDFVATKVLERAQTDRMNKAADPEGSYLSFFEINSTTVPTSWISISNPKLYPVLPMYGTVKTWYDSTAVFSAMPPPPPIVGSDAFNKDIAYVKSISEKRSREQWRISDFWADGAGTYTPPGHWNEIAEELVISAHWSEVRTARAFSLMNRAIMDSGILCWYSKYKYYFPRPSQIDPTIKTATGIPNFPSYTSGHSSFSSAAGTVLGYLFPDMKDQLQDQFIEAGDSRVYGGIHYQFDNLEGRKSGIAIGTISVSEALSDGADN